MDKKKVMRALMLSLCIVAVNPSEVEAKEENTSGYSTEDLKDKAKSFFKWTVNTADDINNKINSKLDEVSLYKEESLWLITDMPNVDPSEERHYYFVDKSTKSIVKTFFYDKNGNKVEKNSSKAVRKVETQTYMYTTVSHGVEEEFVIQFDYDLIHNTFTTNFVDFGEDYLWDPDLTVEYGRFEDISMIIPEDMRLPKYSDVDLENILKVINDCDYELFPSSLKLELK